MRATSASLAILVLALVAVVPARSLACPVCFSAVNTSVLETYYWTAALLTVLPFVLAGVFAVWLRRRLRSAAAAQSFQA